MFSVALFECVDVSPLVCSASIFKSLLCTQFYTDSTPNRFPARLTGYNMCQAHNKGIDSSFSLLLSVISEQRPTFVIEVVDVRRTGHLGDEAGEPIRPADETVPFRRARFIWKRRRRRIKQLGASRTPGPHAFTHSVWLVWWLKPDRPQGFCLFVTMLNSC